MVKGIKSVIGVVLGAILGYSIIQLISGDNTSTSFHLVGFLIGALIAFVIISVIKHKLKKVQQENE